ncbi:IS5 family transposase, partial [Saccharospirillum impatiens]
MEITTDQFKIISQLLPKQRGNVTIPNIQVLNAILYVAEHGCKWRGLPEHYGNWHTIYTRANRWAKAGVLDHVMEVLQAADVINIQVDHVSLDSTAV